MSDHTWPDVLGGLLAGRDLTEPAAGWAMEEILSGSASPAQLAAFVTALRAKGETAHEVDALVGVMLRHARLLDFGPLGRPVALDVVGTGGDQAHTVNISTMSALVCAAAGVPVIKHGNRASSSSTGTADVLEELGVVIDLPPDAVVECVRESGIGFCFAQVHHPAMRHAGPTRRELGIPTVFNILGPLTNPGLTQAALVGSASQDLAPVMADVLRRRGVHAVVVRGDDGLDETSTAGPSQAWDATGAVVVEERIHPEELGIAHADRELLRGGDRHRNAHLLRATLDGQPAAGPDADRITAIRDAVALNAAVALVAHDAARRAVDGDAVPVPAPLVERVAAQLPRVRATLDSGAAITLLDAWASSTQRLRPPA